MCHICQSSINQKTIKQSYVRQKTEVKNVRQKFIGQNVTKQV